MAKRIAANVTISPTPEGQRGPWWCSMHVKVGACDHNPCLEKKTAHTTWFKQQERAIEPWFQRSFRIRASFRSLNPAVLACVGCSFPTRISAHSTEVRKHFFRLAGTDFQLDTQTILESRQRKQTLQYSNLVQVYLDYVLTFSQHFNILTNSGSQSRDDS